MGMMDNSKDFDFVVTATRTENDRKLKVPGDVPAVGKMSFEIARLREEIKTKNVPQLREILERQDRILNNPGLVKKLPDKGEKARSTKDMILKLIKEKEKVDDLEEEMKKMKINTEKMEWKGGLLDSDDDSDPENEDSGKNPLSVLAQGIVPKVSSKAKSEIEEGSDRGKSDLELFAIKEAEKVDNLPNKETFVPYKAAKTEISDETKCSLRINPAPAENPKIRGRRPVVTTPAIPLPSVYNCETKQLSLAESMQLQQQQDRKLRDIQLKHAAEKLSASKEIKDLNEVRIEGGQFEEYRDNNEEEEQEEDSGDEGVGVVGIRQMQDD